MKCPNCGDEHSIPLPLGFQCRKCGVTFGRHLKDKEIAGDEIEYLQFFRSVTLAAIHLESSHPIETVVSILYSRDAAREFGERLDYYLARFLCDNFEAEQNGRPHSAVEVLNWCNEHFPIGHPMVGVLSYLQGHIGRHLSGT